MSIQTWFDEFGNATDLEKWEGMTPENLEKHSLTVNELDDLCDNEGNTFAISADTCQICNTYLKDARDYVGGNIDKEFYECMDCPLAISRDGFPCYEPKDNELEKASPYEMWTYFHNPEAMITALRKIKDQLPMRSDEVNVYRKIGVP